MDDVMILLMGMSVDLRGFNREHFGIFSDEDRVHLEEAYEKLPLDNFVSILSPDQKWRLACWLCERTTYTVPQLVKSLETFTKYLKRNFKYSYPDDVRVFASKGNRRIGGGIKKFKD